METLRKLLLAGLALALVLVTILTWGSMGSIITCFCLILMGAALLFQRFLTSDRENDFMEDPNG